MSDLIEKKAILVGVNTPDMLESNVKEYFDELDFLCQTADIFPVKRFSQKLQNKNSKTFVGEGKLQEIKNYILDNEDVNFAVFDDELSPSQLKNIESELKINVLDRTSLILSIFESRAKTAYAKTQVELASLQYLLPRLSRMWGHLDRQRGGGGVTSRGMGEKQIEADQRIIRSRIALLKEDLKNIDKQMSTQRKNRGKKVKVSLVGYTNVGKSTLMNLLSKSEVFAENKLFATLDTTVRKVTIDNLPFLLSDTVGFIRKLPHHLVESFKSTLDEVREADLLVHVVDISHPNFEEQYGIVNQTLADIGGKDIPILLVFNKIDEYCFVEKDEDDLSQRDKSNFTLEEIQKTWIAKLEGDCVFISAKDKTNIDELKEIMYNRVKEIHIKRYPYNDFIFEKYDNL